MPQWVADPRMRARVRLHFRRRQVVDYRMHSSGKPICIRWLHAIPAVPRHHRTRFGMTPAGRWASLSKFSARAWPSLPERALSAAAASRLRVLACLCVLATLPAATARADWEIGASGGAFYDDNLTRAQNRADKRAAAAASANVSATQFLPFTERDAATVTLYGRGELFNRYHGLSNSCGRRNGGLPAQVRCRCRSTLGVGIRRRVLRRLPR